MQGCLQGAGQGEASSPQYGPPAQGEATQGSQINTWMLGGAHLSWHPHWWGRFELTHQPGASSRHHSSRHTWACQPSHGHTPDKVMAHKGSIMPIYASGMLATVYVCPRWACLAWGGWWASQLLPGGLRLGGFQGVMFRVFSPRVCSWEQPYIPPTQNPRP